MSCRLGSYAAVIVLVGTAGCGGGTAPTAPAGQDSFLAGRWTGTVTIEREGEATTAGPNTWTFATVAGTNQQTFKVTIQSQHAWLPITTTVTSDDTVQHDARAHQHSRRLRVAPRMHRQSPQRGDGDGNTNRGRLDRC